MAPKGQNSDGMQEANRALILRILADCEVCTRAELARRTGLKQASITIIISKLIEQGLVVEEGMIGGQKGRRSIGIKLNAAPHKVIAVKLVREGYLAGVFDIKGKSYERLTEDIDPKKERAPETLARIVATVRTLQKRYPDVHAVGITLPGPYLRNEGRIAIVTEAPGWEGINFHREFENKFGIPVFFEHGANAGALAEWRYGQEHLAEGVLVHMVIGGGVGAGVVSNGKIFTGANGVAGELGHITIDMNGEKCTCGNRGCLELYCSTFGFMKRVRQGLAQNPASRLAHKETLIPEDVFAAARTGDAFAQEMVAEEGRIIGCGVVSAVNMYDPDVVVLSDSMTKGGPQMLEVIRQTVRERILPDIYEKLGIRYTNFGIDPILYGAAAIATDKLLRNPALMVDTVQAG